MSIPGGILSREWLVASRERMTELEGLLVRQLPEQLYGLIKAHPALYTIVWRQGWPGAYLEERRFSLSLSEIEFEPSVGCCDELSRLLSAHPEGEAFAAHREQLEGEITSFLHSVPVCVLVRSFGHSHRVVFHRDSHETEFQD